MIEETETLRQHVMINQFTVATGCTQEQARQLLYSARWEYETALSLFFQEAAIQNSNYSRHLPGGQIGALGAPTNTPATPPDFPDALLAFQKLQSSAASGSMESWGPPITQFSPAVGGAAGNLPMSNQNTFHAPKVLSSLNSSCQPCHRYSGSNVSDDCPVFSPPKDTEMSEYPPMTTESVDNSGFLAPSPKISGCGSSMFSPRGFAGNENAAMSMSGIGGGTAIPSPHKGSVVTSPMAMSPQATMMFSIEAQQ